jgi:hypothetical protein
MNGCWPFCREIKREEREGTVEYCSTSHVDAKACRIGRVCDRKREAG